ncbi:alkaline phosphatase family protein [Halovivax sp.]|uniref:alkaline phosphatase family protein n=1 Tax=Halovivax sp. TaxID=1935978 RepID=UPI0025B7FF40|nr:alkaline phosphatase family protein [Halovivax sp.]
MDRSAIERRLLETGADEFLTPAYEDYCVANVTETLLSLLDAGFDRRLPDEVFRGVGAGRFDVASRDRPADAGRDPRAGAGGCPPADAGRDRPADADAYRSDDVLTDVETVVCVLLDGFGYDHWTRVEDDHALLRRFAESGAVTPLTSIYPSETAAAFTSIHTGRPALEHGLLGWFQYLAFADRDAITLPFTTLDGTPIDDVAPGATATDLFEGCSIYEGDGNADATVRTVLPASIADSKYSLAIYDGVDRIPYEGPAAFAATVRAAVDAAEGPTLIHAYEPSIDAVGHAEGTSSERMRATVADLLRALREEFVESLDPGDAARTLLVVTADHGILDTVPAENVDMTTWDRWRSLQGTFRVDEEGEPRRPTGSPRNAHFHVRPDRRAEARELLEERVDGLVLTRETALERDLFGPGEPSALFERRCGDLIAVHRDRGLCWRADDTQLVGMHGGVTRAEMLVPFAAARVDALR